MDNNTYQPGGFAFNPAQNQPAPTPVNPAPVTPTPMNPNPVPTPVSTPAPASQKPAKKINSSLIKTIALVLVSLLAVTFIVLFIWMYTQYDEARTNVEGKINVAVQQATNELETKLQTKFAEEQKYPFKKFGGPVDFGSLNFEYPKTWSVYIPDDASDASNYHAYLNPDHVDRVDDETIMALRVSIENVLLETALEDYNDGVAEGTLTMSTTVVNGANVNIYTGTLPSNHVGIACLFKIRDKTVTLTTDAMIFKEDFEKILNTVRFNS